MYAYRIQHVYYHPFIIDIFSFFHEQFYVGCSPGKFSVKLSDFGNERETTKTVYKEVKEYKYLILIHIRGKP